MKLRKEKTTLKETNIFSDFDAVAMKEYLEKKALEGWRLKDVDIAITFEKTEPKKLVYSVNFCRDKTIDVDSEQKLVENTKAEAIEAGWTYVSSWKGLLFFCAEDGSDLTPVKDINKENKSRRFFRSIGSVALVLLWVGLLSLAIWYGISTMFTAFEPLSGLMIISTMIIILIEHIKNAKLKNMLYREGKEKECGRTLEKIKKINEKETFTFNIILLSIVVLYIVLRVLNGNRFTAIEALIYAVLIIIFASTIVHFIIKKPIQDRWYFTYLLFGLFLFSRYVPYDSTITLQNQELFGLGKTSSLYVDSTIFASKYSYDVWNEQSNHEVEIYKTESTLLKKSFLAAHLVEGKYYKNSQKAAQSNAKEVFEGKGKDRYEIVFVYDNIVIIIQTNKSAITITPADLEIIKNLGKK